MNLPAALDVAIGLVVLYFLLSTVCSFGVELLAVFFWWRKTLLYKTIGRLLTGKSDCKAPKMFFVPRLSKKGHSDDLLTHFWNHPLAAALSPDKKLPSYIEPPTFAAIVIDLALPGATTGTLPATADGLERVLRLAANSGERSLRPMRQSILATFRARDLNRPAGQAETPLVDLRKGIEKWYSEAMARSSGDYKRWAQCWLLALGFIIAVAFNADTIRAAYVLSTNDTLRSATVTYATTIASSTNAIAPEVFNLNVTNEIAIAELKGNLVGQLKELQQLQQLGFPIGWKGGDEADLNFKPYDRLDGWGWIWLIKILGLLATAVAVSIGAPFWYDLLNKIVSLRGAGNRASTTSPAADATKFIAEDDEAVATLANPLAGAAIAFAPSASGFGSALADARAAFDARKAYWLAEASLLAYSAEAPMRNAIQQWGFDLAHYFENVQACQGFLAVSKDKKIVVLAFRGTEKTLEDWTTDAEFKLVASPTGTGQTHGGFTKQLDLVYPGLVTELKKNLQPDTLLYLTGHSLGAALATLMAARLTQDKTCGVCSVHTFGSPRVGDVDFAKNYELALGHCTYRVVNAEDIVTRVPPRVVPTQNWRYDHVGQVVFFDTDGRMQLNAGFWERFLNTVINAVQDFRNELKSSLKDHSMEGYVRLLKQRLNL